MAKVGLAFSAWSGLAFIVLVCIRINEALTQSGPRVPRRKTTGFNLSPFFPTSWVHAAAAAAARR
jgi:hypothetical protein